jgi:hypothetical protein
VVIALLNSNPQQATSSSAAPSPVAPPPAPQQLRATAVESFQVALKWRPGDGTVDVTRYAIYRDGDYVGSAMDGDLGYVDKTALPSQRYRYTVQAVVPGGLSEAAAVVAKTPKAPLSDARLEGVFNMKFRITSSYGVHGFGNKTEGWRYTPKCDQGACTAQVKDIHWSKFATDLHRSGAEYKSTFRLHGYMYCDSVPDDVSVSITLHVTKAEIFKDAWRVTAVSGTMSVSSPASLGCTSGGITYSVTGSLPAA